MTETLRLAFVSSAHPSQSSAGLAHTLAAICRPMVRDGHEVSVYYPVAGRSAPPPERWEGIEVVPVGWYRLGRLPFGRDLEFSMRVARRLPRTFDVVTAHSEHGGAPVMRRVRRLRRSARARSPVAVHAFHGVSLRFLEMGRDRRPDRLTSRLGYYGDRAVLRALEGGGARAADVCVPCSAAVGRDLTALYGVDPGKIRVVYNGVDPQPPILAAEREEARRLLGIDPGRPTLAFIGADTHRKGLDIAIATVAELRRRGRAALLLNVGNPEPSSDGVRSFGVVDAATKRRILAATDVFFLPTRYEGLPAVVQEAAALRIPVVTTEAAHVEWGQPGRDFVLVDPNTVDANVAALSPLLESETTRRPIAEAGFRELGSRRYDDQAREYLAVFRSLLSGDAA